MKFIHKKVAENHVGDYRFQSKFLWFPKTIDGVTYWLERQMWRQEYKKVIVHGSLADMYTYKWVDVCWED